MDKPLSKYRLPLRPNARVPSSTNSTKTYILIVNLKVVLSECAERQESCIYLVFSIFSELFVCAQIDIFSKALVKSIVLLICVYKTLIPNTFHFRRKKITPIGDF